MAISESADSSIKIWQLPAPVSITGTVASLTTVSIRFFPPRGINTSKYSFKWNNSFAVSLLVSSINCTASIGIFVFSSAL